METKTNELEARLKTLAAALKMELRLTDITRYNDVETGRLVLTVGEHTKGWKAIWLNHLRLSSRGSEYLPRGDFTLRYEHHNEWIDCPKIRLLRKVSIWIEPLNSHTWAGMGANVYLCSSEGWPDPISVKDYNQMVTALLNYNIRQLTIDKAQWVVNENLCKNQSIMGMENFWNNE